MGRRILTDAERYERRCSAYKKYRARRSPEKRAQALKMRRLWKAAHRERVRQQNDQWYRNRILRETPPELREMRSVLIEFWSRKRREERSL